MYPLPEGLPHYPKSQWYIAAWSEEITRTPIERYILGEPVALYRTEVGAPVALHGRCPHRSFPLAKSHVEGDNIRCGYHGLVFNPQGTCVEVPTQDQIPKSCNVRSYPIVERWRWLWIWMGDPALADESMIPDHDEIGLIGLGDRVASGFYKHVDGRYMLLHDNLFDLTHIGHLHANTLGAGGSHIDVMPEMEVGENWIMSKYMRRNIDAPPFLSQLFGYSGKVDRSTGLKLHLPCLHVGGSRMYKVGDEPDEERFLGMLRVYHAITPETPTTSHYFFAAGHTYPHDDPDHAASIAGMTAAVINEDAIATDLIERILQSADGVPSEVLLRADQVAVRGRRMFEKLIRAEMPQGAA